MAEAGDRKLFDPEGDYHVRTSTGWLWLQITSGMVAALVLLFFFLVFSAGVLILFNDPELDNGARFTASGLVLALALLCLVMGWVFASRVIIAWGQRKNDVFLTVNRKGLAFDNRFVPWQRIRSIRRALNSNEDWDYVALNVRYDAAGMTDAMPPLFSPYRPDYWRRGDIVRAYVAGFTRWSEYRNITAAIGSYYLMHLFEDRTLFDENGQLCRLPPGADREEVAGKLRAIFGTLPFGINYFQR